VLIQDGNYIPADSWLITKGVDITAGDSLRFFISGGSTSYSDSIEVWVNVLDSLPETFLLFPQNKLGTIYFPRGSVFGQFIRKSYSLDLAAGQKSWIGFRYNNDCTIDGFAIFLDDILIGSPNVGINPTNSNVPDRFSLEQNYPNPFKPTTNIKFSLPQATNVQLIVFNSMGQAVKTLVSEPKNAGNYTVDFDGANLSSGVHFYNLITHEFVETKKMNFIQ